MPSTLRLHPKAAARQLQLLLMLLIGSNSSSAGVKVVDAFLVSPRYFASPQGDGPNAHDEVRPRPHQTWSIPGVPTSVGVSLERASAGDWRYSTVARSSTFATALGAVVIDESVATTTTCLDPGTSTTSSTAPPSSPRRTEDEDDENDDGATWNARSSFGSKDYWDAVYSGQGDFPADEYSWYYGWTQLKRLLAPYMPKATPSSSSGSSINNDRILLPGVGNDPLLTDLVLAGYTHIAAQDYSMQALERQRDLLRDYCGYDSKENGEKDENESSCWVTTTTAGDDTESDTYISSAGGQKSIHLHCSNVVKSLPSSWTESFTMIIEKGLLDAVYLSGSSNDDDDTTNESSSSSSHALLERAVARLATTLKPGGIFVSVSGVVPDAFRRQLFPTASTQTPSDGASQSKTESTTIDPIKGQRWEWLRDGTRDLQAGCFILRKV